MRESVWKQLMRENIVEGEEAGCRRRVLYPSSLAGGGGQWPEKEWTRARRKNKALFAGSTFPWPLNGQ